MLLITAVVLVVAGYGCGGPPALTKSQRSAVLSANSEGERVAALVQVAHRFDTNPDTRLDDRVALRLASTVADSVPELDDALAPDRSFQGASPRAVVALLGGLSQDRRARSTIYQAILRDELRQSNKAVQAYARQPRPGSIDPTDDLNSRIKNLARAHGMLVEALSHKGSDQAGSEKQVPLVAVARCQSRPSRACPVLPSYPVITDCVVLAMYSYTPADRLPRSMRSRPALTTDARVDNLSDWWGTSGPLLSNDAVRDIYSGAEYGWSDGKLKAREISRQPS